MPKPKITWQVPGSDKIHAIPEKAVIILRGPDVASEVKLEGNGEFYSYSQCKADYSDPLDNEKFELVQ